MALGFSCFPLRNSVPFIGDAAVKKCQQLNTAVQNDIYTTNITDVWCPLLDKQCQLLVKYSYAHLKAHIVPILRCLFLHP